MSPKKLALMFTATAMALMTLLSGSAKAGPARTARTTGIARTTQTRSAAVIRGKLPSNYIPPAAPIQARGGRPGQYIPPGRGNGELRRYGRDGRIVIYGPARGNAMDELVAERLIRQAEGLDCGRLGELLRRISNELLDGQVSRGNSHARTLAYYTKNPIFVRVLMARLTEAFKSCNRSCFDDGVAVGIISGTGYCGAATAVGGLPDDGFKFQERLPICETENFVGCQQGYVQAANTVQGCLEFASGSHSNTFNHSISQDCHID